MNLTVPTNDQADFDLSVYKTALHLDNHYENRVHWVNKLVGRIWVKEDLISEVKNIMVKNGYDEYNPVNTEEVYLEALKRISSQSEDIHIVMNSKDLIDLLEFDETQRLIKLPLKWFSPQSYKQITNLLKPFGVTRTTKGKQTSYKLNDSDFSIKNIKAVLTNNMDVDLSKEFDFFPTPVGLVKICQDKLGASKYDCVLEPSAGTGSLIKGLECYSTHCVEVNPVLAGILTQKGYDVYNEDFETFTADLSYSKIIMNPPFGKRKDAKHVNKAFKLLSTGGRLVCITSTGAMTGSDKSAKEFQELVRTHSTFQQTYKGMFTESGKGTGIDVIVTVLERGDW